MKGEHSKSRYKGDPVFHQNDFWWHWDEAFGDIHGPFSSQAEADQACREYITWLEVLPKGNG